MTAPTLVVFLRARLDDDERVARACEHWAPPPWVGAFKQVTSEPGGETQVVASTVAAQVSHHIERWEPARVLREVAAKRRIMAIHDRYAAVWSVTQPDTGTRANCCDGCGYGGICDDPNVEDINDCPELRALAAIYSDHADYLEEWKP